MSFYGNGTWLGGLDKLTFYGPNLVTTLPPLLPKITFDRVRKNSTT